MLIRAAARRATTEILTIALFLLLAIAMTWPLAIHLRNAVSWPQDPFFTAWNLDWDYHATFTRAHLFDANIFYPAHDALAFSEHLYGIAVLFFPFFAAGVAPLVIHNLGVLLGFAACGYCAFLLARWITKSSAASIVAGILFAFVGIRFHHLGHLPYIWSFWLPLVLLAVLMLHERPTFPRAGFLAIALAMNGLTANHWLVFGTTAAAIVIVALAFMTERWKEPRLWFLCASAFLIAAIVWLPFIIPYFRVIGSYGMTRHFSEVFPNGAEWRDWLIPNVQNQLYEKWSPAENYSHERTLFPGFVAYALALVGLLFGGKAVVGREQQEPVSIPRARITLLLLDAMMAVLVLATAVAALRGSVDVGWLEISGASTPMVLFIVVLFFRSCVRVPRTERSLGYILRSSRLPISVWATILWLAIGAFGARGLRGAFHTFLIEHVSAFRGIRMPVRWSMIAYVGIAVLAAVGMEVLLRKRSRTAKVVITCVVSVLMLFELRAAPIRWYLVPETPRPVYSWLATVPIRGGVLELPMTQEAAYEYQWRATVHHKPLLNGVSSYLPPDYETLTRLYEGEPIAGQFLPTLEKRSCSLIIVHGGWIREHGPAVRQWIRAGLSDGRLAFVRKFDAGTRADYVFALTRVEPQSGRWRASEVPDPSGRTPLQNAEVFLDSDGWTYSALPIANVDAGPARIVRGPLTVSGWTFAPAGVKDVVVRLGNGRFIFPTTRVPRPDVKAMLPWYPNDPEPGFTITLPRRPHNLNRNTDLQIEVIDRNGNMREQPPFWFSWRPPLKNPPTWNDAELDRLLLRLGADPVRVHPALYNGTASIADYTDGLVSSAEKETDTAYANRLAMLVLETSSPQVTSRYLQLLATGTSRERLIDRILTSPEFAAKYLRKGRIELD